MDLRTASEERRGGEERGGEERGGGPVRSKATEHFLFDAGPPYLIGPGEEQEEEPAGVFD